MPSLPTSLIIVCLVVAWLVVLVPMVAKRREEVPSSDEDSVGARVLDRGTRVGRRRAVLSRTVMAHRSRPEAEDAADDEVGVSVTTLVEESLVEESWDDAADSDAEDSPALAGASAADGSFRDDSVDDFEGDSLDDDVSVESGTPASVSGGTYQRVAAMTAPTVDAVSERDARRAFDSETDWRQDLAVQRWADSGREQERRRMADADSRQESEPQRGADAGREFQRAAASTAERSRGDARESVSAEQDAKRAIDAGRDSRQSTGTEREAEAVEYRRGPARPGRGGFDPAVADRARAYRFRQRRRVALALLVIALAGAVAGWLGYGFGYPAAVAGGVLLVLYFAYLRRQVRIEAEIRQRRLARLDRARQIRPGYRPSVAEQVYAHRTGEIPRPGVADDYQVKSHARSAVPPAGYGRGVPVDLEDSDPAFDDLEYYRPAVYRRRAG